jgi:hypothetical protein
MHISLVLKKIQVPPGLVGSIISLAPFLLATGAGKGAARGEIYLNVQALIRLRKRDVGDRPGLVQAQSPGEQFFGWGSHRKSPLILTPLKY